MKKIRSFSIKLSIITTALFSFLCSCELDPLKELGIEPTILGPIVKTTIDYYDFEDITFGETDYEIGISASEFGDFIPNQAFTFPVPIPAFGPIPEAFPSEYLQFSDFVNRVEVDTASVLLSFNNTFPFPIGAGTRIVVRDSLDISNIVTDHAIERDVANGERYEFRVLASDLAVSNTLEIFVIGFQSPGTGAELVQLNAADELSINIAVEILVINFAEVLPDVLYEIESVSDWEIDIESSDVAAYKGKLFMFVDNGFPTAVDLKIEILDDNDIVTHAFFTDTDSTNTDSTFSIRAAETDGNGDVISKTSSGRVTLFNFDSEGDNFENLTRGSKIRVRGRFQTPTGPDPSYRITESSAVDLQITANLSIDVSEIESE